MEFNTTTYNARRGELMKKVGRGIILLPGNGESPRNFEGNPYFFTQDSTFLYYTGIQMPDVVLVLDCDSGETILFGNEVTLDHKIWMGDTDSLVDMGQKSGISKIVALDRLPKYLAQHSSPKVHYPPPYRAEHLLLLSTLLGVDVNGVPSGMSPELVHAIVSQREIKSSDEVDGLEEALGTTKKMHENVMRQAAPGKTETYLMGLVEQTALSKGARTAYSPIVSVRGEILHNFNYGNTLREGQLLLGDFGALMPSGYTGDITRTIPTSGTFSTQQKEVYQIVLNAQERAVQMLQPGTLFKAVHLAACTEIVEGLTNLGLMRGNAEAAVEAGAHTLFYPHGLGHMIGLDVHDMENLGEEYVGYDTTVKKSKEFGLKSLRLGKSLKQGFVVTIEPGIYFIPELFHHWKSTNHPCSEFLNYDKISSYLDFGGIRIEDEYLVHEDGGRLLGAPIPKQVQEVEDIMSS